ncbi:hypothetical protein FA13DRAFT_1788542 [Coprinellus micaceus]|uniref:Uncharacterized protein n=1 Tax=Coprinellus micaceus TaxID=71717 RepID=A0A4Y7TL70_COPMI|nr:hypothetical protein FA13DRAFT_1788542 [Coprinellus micaceus]
MSTWLEMRAIRSFMSESPLNPIPSLKRNGSTPPPSKPLHNPVFLGGEARAKDSAEERLEGATPRTTQAFPPSPSKNLPNNFAIQHIYDDDQGLEVYTSNPPPPRLQILLEELQRQNRRKDDEILALKSELDRRQVDVSGKEERGRRPARRNGSTDAQLHELKRRCDDAESRVAQQKSMLQAQAQSLTAVDTFLVTADEFSIADLCRMVEELNDEIFQAAMNISDAIRLRREEADSRGEAGAPEEALKAISDCYGEKLVSRLVAHLAADEPDFVLLEGLVQNVFVVWCTYLIQSTCPGNDSVDKVLKGVYEEMLKTREPAVAKNWLAMTSSHLKVEIESDGATEILSCLVAVGGWQLDPSSKVKLNQFAREKHSDIQKNALKVRKVALEGILSAHVEVFRIPTRRCYSSLYMQTRDFEHPSDDDDVICQTGLGLRYSRTNSGSHNFNPTQWEQGIILKARVLLSSTFSPPFM